MDIDVAERHFVHEMQAHHHHPGDPEEDDVEAGDEHARRIAVFQLRRLVRPAEGGEGPERGGKPGVEDVGIAPDGNRSSVEDRIHHIREICIIRLGTQNSDFSPF